MPQFSIEKLQTLRALYLAASPGPWKSYVEGRDHMSGGSFIQTAGDDVYLMGGGSADQDFIAAAYNALPDLIAEIARLQGLVI